MGGEFAFLAEHCIQLENQCDTFLLLTARFIISMHPWMLVSFSEQDLSCPGTPERLSPPHSRIYHIQAPLDACLLLTAGFITSRQPSMLISFSQQDLSRPGSPGCSSPSQSRIYHVPAADLPPPSTNLTHSYKNIVKKRLEIFFF